MSHAIERTVLCVFAGMFCLGLATAQTGDRQQPLVATASQSSYSEAEQRQTLKGDVVISQGSMRVTADEIVVHLVDGAMSELRATGTPVTFEQLDDAGRRVHGEAESVTYIADSGDIELTGNASLTNPEQSLRAESIHYNLNSNASRAEGGESGEVNIVIQPATSEQ
ncbi:MAG: lipopolysaccharide transport periplasmic protein LptA [Pseudomonadota bacterium]